MIVDRDTIVIDAEITTLSIAKKIIAKNIMVLTNSVDVAYELAKNHDNKINWW